MSLKLFVILTFVSRLNVWDKRSLVGGTIRLVNFGAITPFAIPRTCNYSPFLIHESLLAVIVISVVTSIPLPRELELTSHDSKKRLLDRQHPRSFKKKTLCSLFSFDLFAYDGENAKSIQRHQEPSPMYSGILARYSSL